MELDGILYLYRFGLLSRKIPYHVLHKMFVCRVGLNGKLRASRKDVFN